MRRHRNAKGFIVFTKDVHLRGHYKLTSETSKKQTPADKINEQVFPQICLTSFCAAFARFPINFQRLVICRKIPNEGFVLPRIQPYSEIVTPVWKAGVCCLQDLGVFTTGLSWHSFMKVKGMALAYAPGEFSLCVVLLYKQMLFIETPFA